MKIADYILLAKLDREPLPSDRRYVEMGHLVSESGEWGAAMFNKGSVNFTYITLVVIQRDV